MNNESSMEHTLKNGAKLLGLLLLAISIYLSYDGFDQGVTGGNTSYSSLAKIIGLVIAVTMACIQFIFSSRYEQLNTTLKGAGLISYVYSIWTNYLGAKHLLQMDDGMAWATAFAMDIVPEPMIAWSLGDAMKGDVLGNLGKWFTGYQPKPQQNQPKQDQNTQPKPLMNGDALERLRMAQGPHHMQDRRDEKEKQKDKQKHHNNRPNYRG